jgi:hypothetical protein
MEYNKEIEMGFISWRKDWYCGIQSAKYKAANVLNCFCNCAVSGSYESPLRL